VPIFSFTGLTEPVISCSIFKAKKENKETGNKSFQRISVGGISDPVEPVRDHQLKPGTLTKFPGLPNRNTGN
jgi:hypothetical protein